MDVVFNVGLNVSLEFWTIYYFDVSGQPDDESAYAFKTGYGRIQNPM